MSFSVSWRLTFRNGYGSCIVCGCLGLTSYRGAPDATPCSNGRCRRFDRRRTPGGTGEKKRGIRTQTGTQTASVPRAWWRRRWTAQDHFEALAASVALTVTRRHETQPPTAARLCVAMPGDRRSFCAPWPWFRARPLQVLGAILEDVDRGAGLSDGALPE